MSRLLREWRRAFGLKLSRVFLKGGAKRAWQEQIDTHRLFLFTSLHEQQQRVGGPLPDGFAEHLIEQAKALPFEAQREAVHRQLNAQLAGIGGTLHAALGQANDPRPSATALEQAWQRMQQQQQPGSHLAAQQAAASGPLLSQAQLSVALQQQLGYSLAVRPSLIAHQEAGMGLFVQGSVPPGALLAIFPGLVYNKDSYRRMPGYPRIDTGNPYLTARYDGRIVDSLPWGRGWAADGAGAQGSTPDGHIQPPPRSGFISRLAASSDGPRLPIPPTVWVNATTGEAAALELLEGRHPLALAHFANHPPQGVQPNTAIASFTFRLPAHAPPASDAPPAPAAPAAPAAAAPAPAADGAGPQLAAGSAGAQAAAAPAAAAPWLRAYVPNIDYRPACNRESLLTHEASCVGLVALEPLTAGAEVLFNYRLSPSLAGRPAWYVPVDAREENRRWA